ncbi:MAG TPA: ATP-binding protein [Candidatus Saccharimonadales bacterium]|jgi:two-component system nitrogen regulation sensor histidine kinase NtrY|nr:ATP-binding protein [Candidatus Saccharimonadales bacterium]
MASDQQESQVPPKRGESGRTSMDYAKLILLLAALGSLPSTVLAILLLFNGNYSDELRWTLLALLAFVWLIGAPVLHAQVARPLRTLSNMIASVREDDFSFRVRRSNRKDPLSDLTYELNALADRLQHDKVSALEATALLKKVITEIDVAVFTFDQQQKLRIVNRAGEQLMGQIAPRMLGLTGEELNLGRFLDASSPQTVEMSFPGKHGRWAVSHTAFRENGVPHEMLIISDMSRVLREEERQAWQRLIRVLGHELNNSLAPIKSIAGTLASLAARADLPEDLKQDMQQGLHVIENRVESLGRFMQAYTQLARMPVPSRVPTEIHRLVHRSATLERRLPVNVLEGPRRSIHADADQLELVLINLIRNAVDASLDPSLVAPGQVSIGWRMGPYSLEIFVLDEGPGLLNGDNLFVPFFTTKLGGSGIGLILSRQITEAHGGTLQLANRKDRAGCEATLSLPLKNMR